MFTYPRSIVWDLVGDGTTWFSPRGSSCRGISANRVDAGHETHRVRWRLRDNCRTIGDGDSGIDEKHRRGSRENATPRTRSTRSRRIVRRDRSGRRGYTRRRSNARYRQSGLSCIYCALGQLDRPTPKAAISNWTFFLVVLVSVGHLEGFIVWFIVKSNIQSRKIIFKLICVSYIEINVLVKILINI